MLLGRNISSVKWRALFLLVLGCILVASPTFNQPVICDPNIDNNPTDDVRVSNIESILGIASILLMVTISGYSAIYFEAMLKKFGERITIWERNFQLALYSIMLLVTVICYETSVATELIITSKAPTSITNSYFSYTPFKGWTINTIGITLIQALGGLLVAATLKYADAILKTLATSGSIVLSAVLGYLLLGGQLDVFVTIGCMSTILAIFNYTLDA
jgi:UDP-sugar transporter A1/2/3